MKSLRLTAISTTLLLASLAGIGPATADTPTSADTPQAGARLATGAATATAATAQAADSGAWTFTTPNGRALDLQNGNTGDGVFVVANNTPGYHQNWRLIPIGGGEFEVANTDSGKCLVESFPLQEQTCGNSNEEWHFHPVAGKPDTFMLQRHTNGRCLDIVQGAQYADAWTQVYDCNGTQAQQWTVPAALAAQALSLATQYYQNLCTTDTTTCAWQETSQGAAYALPVSRASSAWFNDTADNVQQAFTTIYHSGWSQSLGASVGVSAGVSVPMQAMISSQLTSTTIYESDSSTINGVIVTVRPQNYGWVDFAEVGRDVTGTFTFDQTRFPWTAQAVVTVPVVNDAAGSTMYVAHTSATPPPTTAPAADTPVQTFAATTTQTLAPAATTTLSQDGTGVKVTDTKAQVVTTLTPGDVIDAKGMSHKVSLAVSGNTLIQTIAGVPAGATVDGVMEMPTISMTSTDPLVTGTTSAALKRSAVQSAVHTAGFMRPADSTPPTDAEKAAAAKRASDYTKCVAKAMLGGGIAGGAVGLLGLGFGAIPGAAVGALTAGLGAEAVCLIN